MGKKPFPSHIVSRYGSAHGFRSTKRQQVKAALSAAKEVRSGCAYLPGGGRRVGQVINELEALVDELSVKNWGR